MIQIHNGGPANGSTEKDAALGLVSDVAQEIDPLMEKRVLRKIDIFLMPAMLIGKSCLGSSVAYFSKNILADWVQVMVLYTMTRYDRTSLLFRVQYIDLFSRQSWAVPLCLA